MNKITTLAAISMFAVIMGMGVFAPAMATPNEKSSASAVVCHYFAVYVIDEETGEPAIDEETGEPIVDEALSAWGILYVNSNGALNGHTNHNDMVWDEENETLDEFMTTCELQNVA